MGVSFAITGKAGAKGAEIWGKLDEDISNRIYQHSKREAQEASRLEIELLEYKNSVYSYYTFLKIKNVAQVKTKEDEEELKKHGRTGSFFGMTIRIEKGFIQNVADFYQLCESVFDNLVLGTILTDIDTDGYLTYLIEKLSDGEDCFKRVEKELVSGVNNCEIIDLPDDYLIQKKTTDLLPQHFNVEDVEDKSFLEILFKNSEVCVSREYDSLAEIEKRRKQTGKEMNKQDEKPEKQEKREETVPVRNTIQYPSPSRSVGDNGFKSKKKRDLDFKLLIAIGMNAITLILVFALWHKFNSFRENALPQMTENEISQMIKDEIKAYYSDIEVNPKVNPEEIIIKEVNNDTVNDSSAQQSETSEITWLNINDEAFVQGKLKKDVELEVTAQTGPLGARKDALGNGKFVCDVDLLDFMQNGNKLSGKIPNDCKNTKITFSYKYSLNGKQETYSRPPIDIE